jgi:alpha-ribazole phosphatase
MTRFLWVRHGPTHAKGMVGWTDLPADLSDRAAVSRLEAALPEEAVVVSSDLQRARATADAVAGPRRRLPHERDLRELHFGAWEMLAADDVPDQAALRAFYETPGEIAAPGGESWNAVSARVSAAADRLAAAHPGATVVAVAHFGAILTQLQRALGVSAYEVFAQRIDNLSVTELTLSGGRWQAGRINHRP